MNTKSEKSTSTSPTDSAAKPKGTGGQDNAAGHNADLAGKAAHLNTLHTEIEGREQESLMKAIEAGRLSKELKTAVKHGDWGKWIKKNLTVDQRTLNNYKAVFEAHEAGRLKKVARLSEAYSLLGVLKSSAGKSKGNGEKRQREALKFVSFGSKSLANLTARVESLNGKDKELSAIEVSAEKAGEVGYRLGLAVKKHGEKFLENGVGIIIVTLNKKDGK